MSREAILSALKASMQPLHALRSVTTQPIRVRLSEKALTPQFCEQLQVNGVIVEMLTAAREVPIAVLRYLSAARVPLKIRHGVDPIFSGFEWPIELQRSTGAATRECAATLSNASLGIASTGTVVLLSGEDNPATLAFLTELHIVVLDRTHLVETLDDAFAKLEKPLPRTVHFVSGASRTGDIGGKLVMGAHGPRQLVVLIY